MTDKENEIEIEAEELETPLAFVEDADELDPGLGSASDEEFAANVDPLIDEGDEDEDDEDEDDGGSEPEYNTNADRLFFRTVQRNAVRRENKLRVHIPAPVEFRLKGTRSVYSLDWSKNELKILAEAVEKPACIIEISEDHLTEISEGLLNPQVAMLSDKVHVSGDMGIAMYVFNLFVRRGRRG